MADVKWIKIATDIFDDEKIMLIEASGDDCYAIITVWFKLLCLAGKQNNGGIFMLNDKIAYNEEMLATIFRMKSTTIRKALDMFEQFGMIERIEGVVSIPNWNKHQSLEKLEKQKKLRNDYMKKYMKAKRESEKIASKNDVNTNVKVNVTKMLTDVNTLEEDIDKEIRNKNKKEDTTTSSSRLSDKATTTPTLNEIEDYIKEKNYKVNAKKFFEVNEARGWKIANNEIKSWKYLLAVWNDKEVKSDIDLEDWQKDYFENMMRELNDNEKRETSD